MKTNEFSSESAHVTQPSLVLYMYLQLEKYSGAVMPSKTMARLLLVSLLILTKEGCSN